MGSIELITEDEDEAECELELAGGRSSPRRRPPVRLVGSPAGLQTQSTSKPASKQALVTKTESKVGQRSMKGSKQPI